MQFSQDFAGDGYVITAYDTSSITVNGKRFTSSLIISARQIQENWPVSTMQQLQTHHIETFMQYNPELIILGTGSKQRFPAVELYAALSQQNTGIEVMDTGAACRTYNILTGEGRNVVAGIIIDKN